MSPARAARQPFECRKRKKPRFALLVAHSSRFEISVLGQIELSGNGRFLLPDMPSFIVKS
jgi:hypothetical protein